MLRWRDGDTYPVIVARTRVHPYWLAWQPPPRLLVAVVLLGALVVLGGAAAAPFIYTLL